MQARSLRAKLPRLVEKPRLASVMFTAQRLVRADVGSRVADAFDAREPPTAPGRVGVEIEWIPARPGAYPPAPVGVARSKELVSTLPAPASDARVTFEPGGQIEMSPSPSSTVSELLAHVEALARALRTCLSMGGVELFSSGVDPWHSVDDLGLQTPGPRYSAMQAHFDAIGPAGRRMMRQTAALQICLDLGGPQVAFDRWLVANRAGPALSAAFANSPVLENEATGTPGTRSLIWQRVDSTRTGFDGAQVAGSESEAVESYLQFALDATFIPLSTGPPLHAPDAPVAAAEMLTAEDACMDAAKLEHHLSTLFPPVRPRGHLEIRYLDSLPLRWLPVPVAILVSLIYDPRATQEALEVLEATRLDCATWGRSGTVAMRDGELRSTALALFGIAQRAVVRFPGGYVSRDVVARMAEYRERFPEAGRTPADDQLDGFLRDPEVLATWR
jgi:glutamate--cysteine ligase